VLSFVSGVAGNYHSQGFEFANPEVGGMISESLVKTEKRLHSYFSDSLSSRLTKVFTNS